VTRPPVAAWTLYAIVVLTGLTTGSVTLLLAAAFALLFALLFAWGPRG
jgi:hypothetical protein